MAASTCCTITVEAKVSWWVHPYLCGVALVATLTGVQPDWAKVERTVLRGVRVRAGGKGRWHRCG